MLYKKIPKRHETQKKLPKLTRPQKITLNSPCSTRLISEISSNPRARLSFDIRYPSSLASALFLKGFLQVVRIKLYFSRNLNIQKCLVTKDLSYPMTIDFSI